MNSYAPARCAVDDIRKITEYLLNDDHIDGGPKSKFLKSFGFSQSDVDALKAALENHPVDHEVTNIIATEWGTKFIVECSIRTPDGRNPCIRTVWQQDGNRGGPRFVTAYSVKDGG